MYPYSIILRTVRTATCICKTVVDWRPRTGDEYKLLNQSSTGIAISGHHLIKRQAEHRQPSTHPAPLKLNINIMTPSTSKRVVSSNPGGRPRKVLRQSGLSTSHLIRSSDITALKVIAPNGSRRRGRGGTRCRLRQTHH